MVPLSQAALCALMLALCLVFGRHRLGLTVAIGFLLFWGYVVNLQWFLRRFAGQQTPLAVYGLVGLALLATVFLGLFARRKGGDMKLPHDPA